MNDSDVPGERGKLSRRERQKLRKRGLLPSPSLVVEVLPSSTPTSSPPSPAVNDSPASTANTDVVPAEFYGEVLPKVVDATLPTSGGGVLQPASSQTQVSGEDVPSLDTSNSPSSLGKATTIVRTTVKKNGNATDTATVTDTTAVPKVVDAGNDIAVPRLSLSYITGWVRARWLLTSAVAKVVSVIAFIALSTVVGWLAWDAPFTGMTGGSVLAVVFILAVSASKFLKTLFALLVFVPFLLIIPTLVLALASAESTRNNAVPAMFDPSAGLASFFVFFVVSIIVASLWGKGQLWLTVLLLEVSTLVVALPLTFVFPQFGLYSIIVGFGIVLAWRCDGFHRIRVYLFSWRHPLYSPVTEIRETTHAMVPHFRIPPLPPSLTPPTLHALSETFLHTALPTLVGSSGTPPDTAPPPSLLTQLSPAQLSSLPNIVAFNVRIPKTPGPIDAICITAQGIFFITIITHDGPLKESATHGITLSSTPLGTNLNTLIAARNICMKKFHLTAAHFRYITILTGTRIPPTLTTDTAFYHNDHPLPTGYLHLVTPLTFPQELQRGHRILTPRTQKWIAHTFLHTPTMFPHTPLPLPHPHPEPPEACHDQDNTSLTPPYPPGLETCYHTTTGIYTGMHTTTTHTRTTTTLTLPRNDTHPSTPRITVPNTALTPHYTHTRHTLHASHFTLHWGQ